MLGLLSRNSTIILSSTVSLQEEPSWPTLLVPNILRLPLPSFLPPSRRILGSGSTLNRPAHQVAPAVARQSPRRIVFLLPFAAGRKRVVAVDDSYASSSDPSTDSTPPEVTISPADNGHVVRWHQRGSKKGEPGREIKRIASTKEEALGHADEALGGGSSTKSSKKRSVKRDGQTGAMSDAEGESGSASSPAAHASRAPRRNSARRHRSRIGGRR